jgi:hypothetical protein
MCQFANNKTCMDNIHILQVGTIFWIHWVVAFRECGITLGTSRNSVPFQDLPQNLQQSHNAQSFVYLFSRWLQQDAQKLMHCLPQTVIACKTRIILLNPDRLRGLMKHERTKDTEEQLIAIQQCDSRHLNKLTVTGDVRHGYVLLCLK